MMAVLREVPLSPSRWAGPTRVGRERLRRSPQAGFTLVELVVAVVVLTTGFAMAALTNSTTLRTMIRDLILSDQESLIDEDLAQIRQMAEAYTWCSGEGSLTASGPTCASSTPLAKNYYFPHNPPGPDDDYIPPPVTTAMENFAAACNNKTLTQNLISAINSIGVTPTQPAPPDLTLPSSNTGSQEEVAIRRTAALANPDAASQLGVGLQPHVIRISYRKVRGSTMEPVERDVDILPPVAAWCP